ncbi:MULTISPECIES: 50S ribosomal protein L29 [Citricoccus]|uniref:Large ribosomal subunit protein uL29 n=1 Tax=Citricoccus muralis TaxID=169134 RepID=A0ABY8H3Y9_9MICC|nr:MULTISPECIES: 50S ribosomal protein L29 [Citricoccus]WBL17741.1 50S ribosomal protein L29 [Citricoccus sp. NR2]WFP15844.1 50S ribosomal protein L29 [Citricoccus muralis]
MAVGSKELNVEALDGFDNARLQEELKKAKAELFNLRFQSATGQLDNNGRLKVVKRDIARIYTLLRERELGIRENVEAPAEDVKEEKKSRGRKSAAKKAEKAEEDAE